jgi:uncharacterized damage-inducible protein DinB
MMAPIVDAFLAELDQEAATTRRVLERVPDDKLGWKPHPKSMSLGQLALHVASIPGDLAKLLSNSSLDISSMRLERPAAGSAAELLPTLEEGMRTAKDMFNGFEDDQAMATWRLTKGAKELLAAPRIVMARTLMLTHWAHHRGQLSVYLRLLDVPVPSIYGPSADENPFAGL